MGKSQETFNKKEKEKKRLKKRLEKQEKKEERRANAANGNNISEMMAYIDENGNLSDTPPDPSKKKDINYQDIQISIPVNEVSEEDLIRTGVVTFYNETKGYGFIRDKKSNENVFMHQKEIKDLIKIDNVVTFEVEKTPKGLNALNVQKFKKGK